VDPALLAAEEQADEADAAELQREEREMAKKRKTGKGVQVVTGSFGDLE
jgi:hypothetical protein